MAGLPACLPMTGRWGAEIKATQTTGPVMLHIITEKGRGYLPAESAPDKMHGVGTYDPVTGKPPVAPAGPKTAPKGKPKVGILCTEASSV